MPVALSGRQRYLSGTAVAGLLALGLYTGTGETARAQVWAWNPQAQDVPVGGYVSNKPGTWSTSVNAWTDQSTGGTATVAWQGNTYGLTAGFSGALNSSNTLPSITIDGTIWFETLATDSQGFGNPGPTFYGGTLQFAPAGSSDHANIGDPNGTYFATGALYVVGTEMTGGKNENGGDAQNLDIYSGIVFTVSPTYTGTTTLHDNAALQMGNNNLYPFGWFQGSTAAEAQLAGALLIGDGATALLEAMISTEYVLGSISSIDPGDINGELYLDGNPAVSTYVLNVDNSGFIGNTFFYSAIKGNGAFGGVVTASAGSTVIGEQGSTMRLGASFSLDSPAENFPAAMMTAHFTSGAGGAAMISTGDLDISGGMLEVNLDAAITDLTGVYNLISYSGTLTATSGTLFSAAPTFTGQTPATNHYFEATDTSNGVVRLVVLNANDEVTQYWNGGGSTGSFVGGAGIWDKSTFNWANDTAATGQSAWATSIGVFQGTGDTVTLSGEQGFDQLDFAVNGYSLTGTAADKLSISPYSAATGTIKVGSGYSAMIGVDIIDGANFGGGTAVNTLTVEGDGTLVYTGTKSYTGLTTVSGSTTLQLGNGTISAGLTGGLTLGSSATLSGLADAGNETIDIGGLLTLQANSLLTFTLGTGYGTTSLIDASATGLTISGASGSETLVTVTNLSSLVAGTRYYLISYGDASKLTGTLAGLKYSNASASIYQDTGLSAFYLLVGPPGGTGFDWHPGTGADYGGNGTWTATGNTNWYANGVGPQVAWTQTATAVFKGDPSTVTVDSTSAIEISGLDFQADDQRIVGGAGEKLTIVGTYGDVKLNVESGFTAIIDVVLDDASAGVNVNKTGAGTLNLTQALSYTGLSTVSGGVLQLGDATSGNIELLGGAVINGGGAAAKLSVFTSGATSYAFNQVLQGSVATDVFEIAGTGVLDFTSASSGFAGLANVLSGAALTGTAGGSLGGTTTIADGGILQGSQGASTLLTFSTLSLSAGTGGSSGSIVAVSFTSASTTALFDVTTALTLAGALQVNNGGTALADGTYTIFSSGAAPTGTLAIDYANSAISDPAKISILNNNDVVLIVGNDPTNPVNWYWNGTSAGGGVVAGGPGTWTASASATNWTDQTGTDAKAWVAGHYAYFKDSSSGGTVTISSSGGAITGVLGIYFETGGYELTGSGTIGLASAYSDNLATLDVASGLVATLDADLTGSGIGIRKTGDGTAVFTGTKSYGGDTHVMAGTLQLGNASALVAAGFASAITVDSGATLTLHAETGSMTFANALSGVSGAMLKIAGTQTVSFNSISNDSFVGTTTVGTGATLSGTGALGGDVHIAGGATLSGSYANANALTVGYSTGGSPAGQLVLDGTTSVISVYLNSSNAGSTASLFITDSFAAANYGTIHVDFAGTALQDGIYALIDLNTALPANYDFSGFVFTGKTGQYRLMTQTGGTLTQQIVLQVGPAGSGYWNPTQGQGQGNIGHSGTWTADPASFNWSAEDGTGAGPWVAGYEAIFESNPGTVTVSSSAHGAIEVDGLTFHDTFNLTGGSGEAITMVGGASGTDFTVDAGLTIAIDVVIAEKTTASALNKKGAGTLVLSQPGDAVNPGYTGDTTIAEGILELAYLGDVSVNGSYTIGDNAKLVAATQGNLTFSAGKTLTRNALAMPSAVAEFTVASGMVTMDSDSSAFTGNTNVQNGATLTGAGKLGGQVTVQSGATLQGSVATGATMTAGATSLTFLSGATLDVTLDVTPNSNAVFETGTLTLDDGVNAAISPSTPGGVFQLGVYPLIDHSGQMIGTASNFALATTITTVNNAYFSILETGSKLGPGTISLVVGDDAYSYWNGNSGTAVAGGAGGNGTWTAQPSVTNWTDKPGKALQAWNANGYAVFQGSPGTVTVDSTRTIEISGIEFRGVDYLLVPKGSADVLTLKPKAGWSGTATITVETGSGSSGTATFNVPLMGAGIGVPLTKMGGGELVMNVPNQFGKLNIGEGSVTSNVAGAVPGDVDIASGATWNWDILNASPTPTYAGTITGTGAFNINANLNISGVSSAFAGTVNVHKKLTIPANAQLAGLINVLNGGEITGTGSFGDIHLQSGGSFTIGDGTVGSVTYANSFTTENNSNMLVYADFTGITSGQQAPSSKINVSGNVTSNGGTITIDIGTAMPVIGSYIVFAEVGGTATDAVTWTTTPGGTTFKFVPEFPAGTGHPNEIWLNVKKGGRFSINCTALTNECAVAKGLDSLFTENGKVVDPTVAPLTDAMMAMPDDEVDDALGQLSGDAYASANAAMVANSQYLRAATGAQIRQATGGITVANDMSTATNYAAEAPLMTPFGPFEETQSGINVWFTGYGSWSRIEGDGNAATITDNVGGMFIGADAAVGADMRFGALIGYGQSSYDVNARQTSGSSNDFTLGAYGGGSWGGFGVDFGTAYTWHDVSAERRVNFSTLNETLRGDYNAGTFQAYGSVGYTFDLGNGFQLEPYADAAYINQQSGAFDETGGAAALSHLDSTMNTWFTTLGVRTAWEFQLGQTANRVSLSAGWRHGYGDLDPAEQFSFTGGDFFSITGAPLARDQGVVSAGWETQITDMVSIGINYSGQFGGGNESQNVTGKLNIRF